MNPSPSSANKATNASSWKTKSSASDEAIPRLRQLKPISLTILQDRIKLTAAKSRPLRRGLRTSLPLRQRQTYNLLRRAGQLDASSPNPQSAIRNRRAEASERRREHAPLFQPPPLRPMRPRIPRTLPALFSFNRPVYACPTCRGFGRTITIDYDLSPSPTVPKPSPGARSNPGKPAKAPSANPTSPNSAASAASPWTFPSATSPKNGRSGS